MNAEAHLDHHADHPHHHHDSHRGWVRPGGRRGRWLEPFLLRLVADGEAHGGALIARLNELCLAPEGVDVGMAYRTLREFEAEGLVESAWVTNDGPPRRTYRLTVAGRQALDEWIAVMRERARLIDAFLDGTDRLERAEGG
jgi:PadR family transcriptional regulator